MVETANSLFVLMRWATSIVFYTVRKKGGGKHSVSQRSTGFNMSRLALALILAMKGEFKGLHVCVCMHVCACVCSVCIKII